MFIFNVINFEEIYKPYDFMKTIFLILKHHLLQHLNFHILRKNLKK